MQQFFVFSVMYEHSDIVPKRFFLKNWILKKKVSGQQQKHKKLPSMQQFF